MKALITIFSLVSINAFAAEKPCSFYQEEFKRAQPLVFFVQHAKATDTACKSDEERAMFKNALDTRDVGRLQYSWGLSCRDEQKRAGADSMDCVDRINVHVRHIRSLTGVTSSARVAYKQYRAKVKEKQERGRAEAPDGIETSAPEVKAPYEPPVTKRGEEPYKSCTYSGQTYYFRGEFPLCGDQPRELPHGPRSQQATAPPQQATPTH